MQIVTVEQIAHSRVYRIGLLSLVEKGRSHEVRLNANRRCRTGGKHGTVAGRAFEDRVLERLKTLR